MSEEIPERNYVALTSDARYLANLRGLQIGEAKGLIKLYYWAQ